MKKRVASILAVLMSLNLFGCGTELMMTIPTSKPAESTVPDSPPTETTQTQTPDGYVSLNEILLDSDITMTVEDETILLSEDGLTIELIRNSREVYRNEYVMAVMKAVPIVQGDTVYIHEEFYQDYFCKEGSEDTSLFYGMMFFPEEILAVIDEPDGSSFQQKIAAEVLLPTSMGIEEPHVNMNRAFQYWLLSEYSADLTQELENLGYRNAASYTYSEYAILSGAQTLKQAGITADLTGDIPYDPDMTVTEYYRLCQIKSRQDYLCYITDEQMAFAEEKELEMDDMWFLQRVFDQVNWGDFMKETDATLRATLIEYYEADISYLRSMIETESE